MVLIKSKVEQMCL